ncbi:unnamed protein product [Symbiodinium pilosum]|uniref:Uncharacterized protein n=1 Tax=Symbiodinium pilosum TaxID=2952 RepID=A0A812VXX5_SYMPI|nr:unnamed protein product [Symbiodinium pilosum]
MQHVTGSAVTTSMKLRKMDATELLYYDFAKFCPPFSVHGRSSFVGPLNAFCYQLLAVDPHFGPLLAPFKVHKGYSKVDFEIFTKRLNNLTGYWYAMSSVINKFSSEHYWKYRQARKNSTALACSLIWHRPCLPGA